MGEKLNYLLDTCILIDYLRGEPGVYDLFVKDETEYLLKDPQLMQAADDIKNGKNLVSVSF